MLHRNFALPVTVFVLSLFAGTAAAALPQRTFVGSAGNDANPCSLTLPCRGFNAAIAQTAPGGEVIVLDSAGYGLVTISKSVSIIASPGVYAGISVFATQTGVTVNASAFDTVVLRGLTINSQGGANGIVVNSGYQVHIEDCVVANFAGSAILVAGDSRTFVERSVVRWSGVGVFANAQFALVHVSDSHFKTNTSGLAVQEGKIMASRVTLDGNLLGARVYPVSAVAANLVLVDSVVNNGLIGVQVVTPLGVAATVSAELTRVAVSNHPSNPGIDVDSTSSGGTVTLVLTDSAAVENSEGLRASGLGTTVIVSGSTLARNIGADIVQTAGAVVRTSANNTLTGRGAADIVGALTSNPPK